MLPWLAIPPALALPVSGDLQVRLHEPALGFTEAQAEGLDPFLSDPDLFENAIDCWDRVGIEDFNLAVPINTVSLSTDDGVFLVSVEFGDLLGTGWTVYSEDSETFDTCPEFEVFVDRFAVLGGSFTGALEPVADGETVSFRWVGSPSLAGTIDTDVAWVPDDLILAFVEDLVFQQAGRAMEEALPPILEETLSQPLLDGEYEGLAVTMALQDAEVTPAGLAFGASTDVAFVGEPTCAVPEHSDVPGGRSPELDLTQVGDSHLTIGLTELFTNQLFFAAWESGAFCYTPETFVELADRLEPLVDPDVTGLTGLASLDSPPVLRFDSSGTRLSLTGQRLRVEGYRDNETIDVIDAVIDLTGKIRFGFAPSLTAVTVTIHDIDLDLRSFRLGGGIGSLGPQIEVLVQEWMADALADELKRIPVFDSLFHAAGIAIRIEDISSEPGGVSLALRLYAEDDPAVDRTAPDTSARLVQAGRTRAEFVWSGTDDRDGPLAWAWQIDGQGWSDWTTSTTVRLVDLAEGQHTFTVKARDEWLNEDPSPAQVRFRIQPGNPPLGCGCASMDSPSTPFFLLLPLLALARRRATEGAHS